MTRAPAPTAASPRHRVVVVGAGFRGLIAAQADGYLAGAIDELATRLR